MFDSIRNLFRSPPNKRPSSLGAGLSDQDDDRFSAFQQAWKQGATFDDMFGDKPFQLHGTVGSSGADNHRPDVAKVETFLGDAGFYKPMTTDGPTGWHNTNLDTAIRAFQKAKGLKVDGLLKPNGPTITKISGLLGGADDRPRDPWEQVEGGRDPGDPDKLKPPVWWGVEGRTPDELDPEVAPGTVNPQHDPEPVGFAASAFDPKAEAKKWMTWFNENPRPGASGKRPVLTDPFPGHDLDEDGVAEHDRYAQALVNDSDPSKTAAFLKNVIGWEGNKGRGDVADLLGRFAKVDEGKARNLQTELHKLTGERIPFRVAPTRPNTGGPTADLAEGDEESVRLPKANPWGSAADADRWEAGNMAKVLLGRNDYKDAVKHFAGEFARDPGTAKPYAAAVYEEMAKASPNQALQFARQMADGGLARLSAEEDEGEMPEQEPPPPSGGPEGSEEEKPEEDKPEEDKPEEDKPEEDKEEEEAKNEECERLQAAFEEKQSAMLELRDKVSAEETLIQSIEADIEEVTQQMHDLEELMAELAIQGKGDYDVGRIPKELRYLLRIFPGLGTIRGITEATAAAMEYYHNEILPKRSALEKERQEALARKQEMETALEEAADAADAAAEEFQSGCSGSDDNTTGPIA